uniref:Uncharacterized protein n=1 Tax=Setaria viridis TaxID=4556 RepID=A0A4U6TRZ6_SETVI|nr:hypothetical protein SEVIR_7G196950v2 [Setaria viridis]
MWGLAKRLHRGSCSHLAAFKLKLRCSALK